MFCQCFCQIVDQVFDQGVWPQNTVLQSYRDRTIQCCFVLRAQKTQFLSSTWTRKSEHICTWYLFCPESYVYNPIKPVVGSWMCLCCFVLFLYCLHLFLLLPCTHCPHMFFLGIGHLLLVSGPQIFDQICGQVRILTSVLTSVWRREQP